MPPEPSGQPDHPAERLRAQQSAIAALGLAALRASSLDGLFREAVSLVCEGLGTEMAKVLELKPGGRLLVVAGVGWPDGVVGDLEFPTGADSQAGYALRTGDPVIVEDLRAEQRFRAAQVLLDLGVVSGVNVLIQGEQRPFGVLEADSRHTRSYTRDDVNFLQLAANVLGSAVERRRADEERERFVSIVSHELRGPLTSVTGYAERLRRRLERQPSPDPRALEQLATIREAADRMARIIDTLFRLGQLSGDLDLQEEPLPLQPLLHAAVREARARHPDVKIEEVIPADEVLVRADSMWAHVALGNIIENAAKYSSDGGRVRVSLQSDEGLARLHVRDACGGLSPEDLSGIFERYYRGTSRRDVAGLGLGLYITSRVAQEFRWAIDVENLPGEGCEFRIAMPLEETPPAREIPA